ncbi:glycosyltransferase [Brumimicrobium glaciale]|nr:glycosyltransferase [Brumimicrobium glaciale]
MKKVLILAYDFPPYVSVGGLRPYSWYKYFNEFGIHPVVVTRQWGNKYGNHLDYIAPGESDKTIIEETEYGTVIRTPYKPNLSNRLLLKYGEGKFRIIRKAITAYYEMMQFLCFVGTKSGLYFGAKEYLKDNDVDLIIATGAPHILFKYASKLSKKNNPPWIADYRDPWSQSKSRSVNTFLRKWNEFFEKRYIKSALRIVAVSDFHSNKISSLILDKNIEIISNGYNPDNKEAIKNLKQNNEVLKFAFVGTVYPWHPLKVVLSQFNDFVLLYNDFSFELNFYGINKKKEVQRLINSEFPSLNSLVNIYPKLNNQDLFKILAKHNVMLLFNDYCIVGSKMFDYMALQRKILFCFSEEKGDEYFNFLYQDEDVNKVNFKVQEEILSLTNSGTIVKNQKHLLETLISLSEEFRNTGQIKCETTNTEIYSRKFQVEKLSKIILDVCNKNN